VSDLDGDGFGYDVRSFEPDGAERLLEIKTTCGHERTAFRLTGREIEVAAEKSDTYRIRRVFHFRDRAQMFEIPPPLEHSFHFAGDISSHPKIVSDLLKRPGQCAAKAIRAARQLTGSRQYARLRLRPAPSTAPIRAQTNDRR